MKAALTVACVLVLLAVVYLTASLVILDPPSANVPAWFALAAVLTAQGVLTIIAVNVPAAPASLRPVVLAGAAMLVAIAVWRVRATLTSTHFEGYNLLLGAMLIVQAGLTFVVGGRSALSGRLTY